MHSYQGSHFQMHSLGSCIIAYLVIRKYQSIEFSLLIILGILAFMAIAEFIAYLYFSTYLPYLFIVKNYYLLMIQADYYQHPLLALILVEVTANLIFAFDSLCIPGFVCLHSLFLGDGLNIHLPSFSFLLSNFYFVLRCLQRCCCFVLLVIVRQLIFTSNMVITVTNYIKVLHVRYINHPNLHFGLNNNHQKLDQKRFLQLIKQLVDFINLLNNYQFIIFLIKIHRIINFISHKSQQLYLYYRYDDKDFYIFS